MYEEKKERLIKQIKKVELYEKNGFFEGRKRELLDCKKKLVKAQWELSASKDHIESYEKVMDEIDDYLNEKEGVNHVFDGKED